MKNKIICISLLTIMFLVGCNKPQEKPDPMMHLDNSPQNNEKYYKGEK